MNWKIGDIMEKVQSCNISKQMIIGCARGDEEALRFYLTIEPRKTHLIYPCRPYNDRSEALSDYLHAAHSQSCFDPYSAI